MGDFGVNALTNRLRQLGLSLPKNVIAYGFSAGNGDTGNLTVQSYKTATASVRALVERALRGDVWLVHLDRLARGAHQGLHDYEDPDCIRLFRWTGPTSLNVTKHPRGFRLPLAGLTQALLDRSIAEPPDDLERARQEADKEPPPASSSDARTRILTSIVRRQGQTGFRRVLLSAYGRCCITGNSCADALEAAHIRPYSGPASNTAANGLLLRADIHVLFDLGLLAVDVENGLLKVVVARRIRVGEYAPLHGQQLGMPSAPLHRPDGAALAEHRTWAAQRGADFT